MVRYAAYTDFPGWGEAPAYIEAVVEREGARSVLEIGGGRSPTLNPEAVRAGGIEYTVNDIDPSELALVDPAYATLCFDMSASLPAEVSRRRFDLIFSRMVNEHVADGATYYANIFRLLNPGGLSVHFFATLFTLPTLVNLLVPETVSARVRSFAFARSTRDYRYEKFPARYSWCRGPGDSMTRRFQAVGFDIEDYVGFFGHAYYRRVPALQRLEQAKARWLIRHPISALTSSALVSLRKPESTTCGIL
jgi:SAM-dependent methyltransferase